MKKRPVIFDLDEISHRRLVLEQINRCNRTISEFTASPTTIDPLAKTYDPMQASHEGKKIALAIRVLLSISRRALPKEFFTRIKTANLYKKAFEEGEIQETDQTTKLKHYRKSYPFLSEDPKQQFKGILLLLEFYDELIAAIFSLEEFSDVQFQRTNKQYQEDAEEEDALFSIE